MLNHNTHPADPIWDKKTNAFDTSMASPSRQHNFTVRVSLDTSSLLQSLGAAARDRDKSTEVFRFWALPMYSTLGCNLKVFEFERSRHQRRWDPFVFGDTIMDNGYINYTYINIQVVWWLVFRRWICPFRPFQIFWSIIHSWFGVSSRVSWL